MTCEQIAAGEIDYTRCPYGRLHSPVTRLVTEARSCLSIGGKPLGVVDVRNSQVVFLAMVMLESFFLETSGVEVDDPFGWSDSASSGPSLPPGVVPVSVKMESLPPVWIRPDPPPPAPNPASRGGPAATRTGTPAAPPPPPRGMERKTKQIDHASNSDHCTALNRLNRTTDERVGTRLDTAGMPADARHFVRDTLDGTLYDGLMADVGTKDRKAFKPRFFRACLYGNPSKLRFADEDTTCLAAAFRKK